MFWTILFGDSIAAASSSETSAGLSLQPSAPKYQEGFVANGTFCHGQKRGGAMRSAAAGGDGRRRRPPPAVRGCGAKGIAGAALVVTGRAIDRWRARAVAGAEVDEARNLGGAFSSVKSLDKNPLLALRTCEAIQRFCREKVGPVGTWARFFCELRPILPDRVRFHIN
uniref:Uncharacterized protein n=1 Tax=Oryza meridionalis TaxID=40149 RepID=A0A0E0EZX4_9ORYZ